jgi:hypothetical protein
MNRDKQNQEVAREFVAAHLHDEILYSNNDFSIPNISVNY